MTVTQRYPLMVIAVLFGLLAGPALGQAQAVADPVPIMFLDSSAPAPELDGSAMPALASVAPVPAVPPVDLETATAADILAAVELGKLKLEAERQKRLEIWGGAPPSYAEYPAKGEIILAIWRQDTGYVNLYLADKQGRRLWVKSPGAPPVSVSYHAQLYSQYWIEPVHQATVVAVLYPVMEERGNRYHTNETIYVPPSKAMRTPAVLAAGSDYLSYLVEDAFAELARREVRSRAFPERFLHEAIDPYLIKSVVVIEHSSHHALLSDNDPEATLGRFYANLALNGESAFAQAESYAGALGIAQFMPKTYALFVNGRPDIGLIPDFREGMADHRNAIMAAAAYFDDSLRMLPEEIRADYATNPALAADYLAAAYNGGTYRVRTAVKYFGADWDQRHNSGYSLRTQTVNYVKKLRKVYAMLQSGVFATPAAPSNALPSGSVLAQNPSLVSSLPQPAGTATGNDPAVAGTLNQISQSQLAVADPLTMVCFGDGSCVSLQ
jgi:hypothetical protein